METKKIFRKIIWEVSEFPEKIKQYATGKILLSPFTKIIVDGKKTGWKLLLFPNGNKEEDKGFVSLFLQYLTKDEYFDSVVKFRVCSDSKTLICNQFTRSKEEWKESSVGRGYAKLISHEHLGANFGKCESLTVFCELVISIPSANAEKPATEPPSRKARHEFANFLQNDKLKDCELHASDGTIFKSHKIFLAAMSPIFEKIFTDDSPEATVLKLNDIDSKTLKQLLNFCHCEEIVELKENALKLLDAANKFKIDELKEVCVQSLIENLSEENVLPVLSVATKYIGTSVLFNECMDVIVRNYRNLIASPDFRQLPNATMLKIIEHMMPRMEDNPTIRFHTP